MSGGSGDSSSGSNSLWHACSTSPFARCSARIACSFVACGDRARTMVTPSRGSR